MKKTHRAVLSILLVLALLVSLPISAMAEEPEAQPKPVVDNTSANNHPTVNSGEIMSQNTGTVTSNEGTITTNGAAPEEGKRVDVDSGTVEENKSGATIKDNYGTVNGNSGNVENNYGYVSNKDGGIVEKNNAGGEMENNGGTVGENSGSVTNTDGGRVEKNNAGGIVYNISGTVGKNSGYVTNTDGGIVEVNEYNGVVHVGTDDPNATAEQKVTTNYGTVVSLKQSEESGTDYDETIYYGVHAMYENKEKVFLGSYECAKKITIDELKESAKKQGYKIFSIEKVEDYSREEEKFVEHNEAAPQNGDSPEQTPGTTGLPSFRISAPTRLKLFWEKIVSVVKPAASTDSTPEAKPVKAAALPTTVAAEDVKVGTVVRAKGQTFKVIEMDDGSMTVVTMGKLSKKDMEDLKAFLAKYFTPAQIELLLGEPELISGELAEKLFGGNTNHIVFKAARNLFA